MGICKIAVALSVGVAAVVLAPGLPAQAAITPDVGIQIKAAHSNMCLNVDHGLKDDDTAIVQYSCAPTFSNDEFKIVPKGTGTYQIVAVFDNKCLNVYKGTDTNNTPVHQYTCSNTATNNLWRFQAVSGKPTFRIVSVESGRCMNVTKASQEANAALIIYDCASGLNDRSTSRRPPPGTP